MKRALRLRDHSRRFIPENRAQLKPAKNSCTVLALDEVRSDVLGVTDGSAVIGHEEMKKKNTWCKTLLSHRNNVNIHSRFTSRSCTESNQNVHFFNTD